MKPGAVVVDLAAEGGGNCALTRPGETVEHGGVTVFGPLNVPSLLPVNASETYARNISDFLGLLISDGELAPRWDDEIVAASCLTRDGVMVHEPTRALVEELAEEGRSSAAGGPGASPMSGWTALYIFMLAAFTGYVIIGAVPVILHTPLMSGANFVHGIVLVGAMVTLGFATRRSRWRSACSPSCSPR